ncbi:condensation domain-containing protein, partial [Kibdelosporangium lantanae]
AAAPFDLTTAPLLRPTLIRYSATDHVFLLVMHHIIADGWSVGVLLRELSALCGAFREGRPDPLPELAVQYADFALWQRQRFQQGEFDKDIEYWRQQLGTSVPTLELPMARAKNSTTPEIAAGGRVSLSLEPELVDGLEKVARQERGTLYMTLLAAYVLLLHKHSGQKTIVVGTPIANRSNVQTEELIGFFVNALALKVDADGGTFRDLLRRARKAAIGAFSHQDVPFEKLVEVLRPERRMSQAPLFQVMFVLQNTPREPLDLPGLGVTPVDVHTGTAKFDLLLAVTTHEGHTTATLEYDSSRFDEDTVTRLLQRYRTLLASIVDDPDSALTELAMLPEDELAELRRIGRRRAEHPGENCLHDLFDEQVARTPDAIAVTFEGEHLTYRELQQRADRLASRLYAMGVRRNDRVGLFLDRSFDTVVAILGVLKAGGTYVPMDAAYPTARLHAIVTDSAPAVVLSQRRMLDQLP